MNPNNNNNSDNQVNEAAFIQWARNNPQFLQNISQQPYVQNPQNINPLTQNLSNSQNLFNLNHIPQASPNINNAYPYYQNSIVQPSPQQWSQSSSQYNESYPMFSSQIPSLNSNVSGSGFDEHDIGEEDTEVGVNTPSKVRPQNNFNFKEDEALISSFMRISTDSCIGTNQKLSSFWNKVKVLYDAARDANPDMMKVDRTPAMLTSRWGRLTKTILKFVGCIDAATRDLSGRTSGMNEEDIIQRARGIFKGKFTWESQWRMLKKYPKWHETLIEYHEGDKRIKPRQGSTPTTPSDDSGKRTRLSEGGFCTPSDDGEGGSRGRPMGRNEAKRKKGKAAVSSSVEVVQDWGDNISQYCDVQLKKLEAAQLREARKQSQMELEMRKLMVEEQKLETEKLRLEREHTNSKVQVKLNLYESLVRRPNLTHQEQEMTNKLFNEIQDHLN